MSQLGVTGKDELFVKAVNSSSDVEFAHGQTAELLRQEGANGALLYYSV